MEEDIVLKIKEKESLQIVKYVSQLYGCFLLVLGLFLNYNETIVQVTFIFVFSIIVDMLNSGEIRISSEGFKTKFSGYVKYTDIYRLEFKERLLVVYTRGVGKPYKIFFSKIEDIKEIKRVYKYIDAKVKRMEADNQYQEYLKKYL